MIKVEFYLRGQRNAMENAYTENKSQEITGGTGQGGARRFTKSSDQVNRNADVNSFNFCLQTDTFTQTKLQELNLRIEDSKPSVIAISEVKLKNFKREIQLSEFNIEGYEIVSANVSKD